MSQQQQQHKAFTIPNLQRIAKFSCKTYETALELSYVNQILHETMVDFKTIQIIWERLFSFKTTSPCQSGAHDNQNKLRRNIVESVLTVKKRPREFYDGLRVFILREILQSAKLNQLLFDPLSGVGGPSHRYRQPDLHSCFDAALVENHQNVVEMIFDYAIDEKRKQKNKLDDDHRDSNDYNFTSALIRHLQCNRFFGLIIFLKYPYEGSYDSRMTAATLTRFFQKLSELLDEFEEGERKTDMMKAIVSSAPVKNDALSKMDDDDDYDEEMYSSDSFNLLTLFPMFSDDNIETKVDHLQASITFLQKINLLEFLLLDTQFESPPIIWAAIRSLKHSQIFVSTAEKISTECVKTMLRIQSVDNRSIFQIAMQTSSDIEVLAFFIQKSIDIGIANETVFDETAASEMIGRIIVRAKPKVSSPDDDEAIDDLTMNKIRIVIGFIDDINRAERILSLLSQADEKMFVHSVLPSNNNKNHHHGAPTPEDRQECWRLCRKWVQDEKWGVV